MRLRELARQKVAVIHSMGAAAYLREAARKMVLFPSWILFRIANRRKLPTKAEVGDSSSITFNAREPDKESAIIEILSMTPGGRFLEVGIGASPHEERLRIVSEKGIEYTACDFKKVCDLHNSILERTSFQGKSRFLGNAVGTYVWSLYELAERGETFDVVYLDGHHTFYVDLPAVTLADLLLRPGGYLLVDDVDWSLQTLRANMFARYREWLFYRTMYDFREYEPEQQSRKHLRMIVDLVAIRQLGYEIDEARSTSNWWALRKRGLTTR